MNTYIFLQHYWWFIVSLLGAILVFLLFVQGGNSLIFCLGKTEEQRKMIINSTGRKWEFTFTTLVTFGGAFFASFPLFYSTSFGGAYWLWMIILFTFVLQAVSYEFQSKAGNLLGKTTYRAFLVINGVVGPVLLGGAVATFFTGSEFYINKGNIADTVMPVISSWANAGHGLDALLNPWNVVLGLAVFFLARILGALYFINNIGDADLVKRCRRALWGNTGLFLVFFLAFVIRTLLAEGYAVNPETGEVFMEPYKYLTNFIEMPVVLLVFLIGVLAVLWGIVRTVWKPSFDKGICLQAQALCSRYWRCCWWRVITILPIIPLPPTCKVRLRWQTVVPAVYVAGNGLRVCPSSFCACLHFLRMAQHRQEEDRCRRDAG